MKLILASQSPRRKQLLTDAALEFELVIVPTDESYPDHLTRAEIPEFIAEEKALTVYQQLTTEGKLNEETVILAADTIVLLQDKVIGKPKDAADAHQILRSLSGQTHEVITGVCIMNSTRKEIFHSLTKVHFNELSAAQIDYYISRYQPFDKAGAYAIQEWIGLIGISAIEGDLYNVIGLPVNKVVKALDAFSSHSKA
ncbi:MAG: septum formation protein Maf [Sphingobacteriales bacterium]|nr:MAG: septum formation protein Maf [Sphingobacteriales bacterium]